MSGHDNETYVDAPPQQTSQTDAAASELAQERRRCAAAERPVGVGNMPADLTSFVGRRNELSRTKALLDAHRLVTLTGVGGVGKTRLALQTAARILKNFADGVWLVELGDLSDGALLGEVITAALGLRTPTARAIDEVLQHHLSTRELLLVLDNCEQVVAAVAELCLSLLHTCPKLRILTTSREALNIPGEMVLRVPPLTVPDPENTPSVEGLPQYDAVALFADRARVALPTFHLDTHNALTVTRICQQLDGLPLAVELAAARLRAMSPEQILHRLIDRFRLLTHGGRGIPPRQQTLRACIDWSFDLCTAQEQAAWSRIAVFSGGMDLDAVERVCSDDEVLPATDALDVLTSLVDKSIVTREESGEHVRVRMLDTIREYGREKAQQRGEYLELRRRHLHWCWLIGREAEDQWISARQLEWLDRLHREQSNLREALEFSLSDQPQTGIEIAAAAFTFWNSRGLFSEGRRWLDSLLAVESSEPSVARAMAFYCDSVLALSQGDLGQAKNLVDRARLMADRSDDEHIRAIVAQAAGMAALFGGDPRRACALLSESLEVLRDRGAVTLHVAALVMLGVAHELQSESEQAIRCYEEALEITGSRGESVYRSYSLWAMGVSCWRNGDSVRATDRLVQGLRLADLVGHPVGSASCLEALAWIANDSKDHQRAAVLMGAAYTLSHRSDSVPTFLPIFLEHHEACMQGARRALGERAFISAYSRGTKLGPAPAIAFALERQNLAMGPATMGLTPLTPREQEIAALISEGLTSRAIAGRLVLSERTVDGHIQRILRKLGFTSRTQIAAWMVERRSAS